MDMHIDSGPTATAPSGSPNPSVSPLHLDLPANDMMEVEPEFCTTINMPCASASTAAFAQSSLMSPSAPANDAAGAVGLRPVPSPPVVLVTASDVTPLPKLKLHELFVRWLVKPENSQWLNNFLDEIRAGKRVIGGRSTSNAQPAPPGSPVSRLIHSQLPFGGSPRVHRQGGSAQQTAVQNGIPLLAQEIDLGRGCIDFASGDHYIVGGADRVSTSTNPSVCGNSDVIRHEAVAVKDHATDLEVSNVVSDEQELHQTILSRPDGAKHGLDSHGADPVSLKHPDGENREPHGETQRSNAADSASEELKNSSVELDRNNDVFSDPSVISKPFSEGVSNPARSHVSLAREDVLPSPKVDQESYTVKQCEGVEMMESEEIHVDIPSATLPPRPQAHAVNGTDSQMSDSSSSTQRRAIPRFYFPRGKGAEEREKREWEAVPTLFEKYRTTRGGVEGISRSDFSEVVMQCLGLPSFFAPVVYDRILKSSPEQAELSCGESSVPGSVTPVSAELSSRPTIDIGSADATKEMFSHSSGSANAKSKLVSDESQMIMANDAESADTSRTSATQSIGAPSSVPDTENSAAMNVDAETSAADSENGANVILAEERFREFYLRECRARSREERMFYFILPAGPKRDYLIPTDFKPVLRALLMRHQGLAFLHATPEFQLRYSETVVERIYFSCSRTHNGRLTLEDIKRCRLLDTFTLVDEEEDINRERKYFSYEHFYVLYCRFWELDTDHDLQIDREDLMRYGGHSLTYRIVDRIFGGYARRLDNASNPSYMSYTDFIWFCLSEEDKNSDTAIDYWYRCIDMDGDGVITMYDMEHFYKEQLHRMESFGHEPVQIRDILCQLLDMVKPNASPPHVRKNDLKASRLAGNFFNVLFNLNKFFALEARDPLQIRQEHATPELTDWDRFAALEYLRLSAEEEGEEDDSWDEVGDAANPLIVGEAPF